ncbi:MAG: hypothetical protein K8S54_12195 [Spirochaetia bacterium]|nr:hypothetical protein [Spirochaetia bacterium]
MRIEASDPIFAQYPLHTISKYYLANRIREYTLYSERNAKGPVAAAPASVLIQDRNTFVKTHLSIRSLEIRAGKLIVLCGVNHDEKSWDGENLGALLVEGENRIAIAQNDPSILTQFPIPAGLFNYGMVAGKFEATYSENFGHGEHTQYFIYWIGTPFGIFSPASFLGVEGLDRTLSQEIFDELNRARILRKNGQLVDPEKLKKHEFSARLRLSQAEQVRKMILEPARLQEAQHRFNQILKTERAAILRDLAVADLEINEHTLSGYVTSLSPEESQQLFSFYVARIVAGFVNDQVVRNRGILMENLKKEALLLLYEPIEISSHFFENLTSFVLERKPGYSVYIALAYRKAPMRRRENYLHPYVEALRDLENKRYLDSAYAPEENPDMM